MPTLRPEYGRTGSPRGVAVAAVVVLSLLGTALTGCTDTFGMGDDPAEVAARSYAEAWENGKHGRAGRATDAPAEAESALDEVTETLRAERVDVRLAELVEGEREDTARVPFTATMQLDSLGEWRYRGSIPMRRDQDETRGTDGWVVDWSPAVVHPALTVKTRLARERALPPRAVVQDRRGRALMEPRPVVNVGIWPAKLADGGVEQVARAVDVDAAGLAERVKAVSPDQQVPVITLRKSDFAEVSSQLRDVPGVLTTPSTLSLAPTPTFGRAVLGTVRPATAETLESAGPYASAVDAVGSSGLQLAYQQRLAGRPSGRVMVIDRENRGVVETVHEFAAEPGEPLRTSLDLDVQRAAEDALAGVSGTSALVAVDTGTGGVLAAANGPAGSSYNRAFVGRYPPGSTFKVVTSAALLAGGLDPERTVGCPGRATVAGKEFGNDDDFALGDVPFRTAFARSCNTAFVQLAEDLSGDALAEAAATFGLGREWDLGAGTPAFSGEVPATPEPVQRAAAAIGQGQVLASPLAMATVASAVASGQVRAPTLVTEDGRRAGRPVDRLEPGRAAQLRSLMRAVVTSGSGDALAGLPGQPGAKTGTAEFGETGRTRTHAWMIGFQRDVAFAVLLESGGAGGADAGPVAARFLQGLD